ncbi:hypothetical protein [Paraburkholderia sp. SIMBA_054]|uniref:hypothetical protein n=1 Tax=Paraburkholderia sp. SIMBA_054 TaxID=3085795 RepID=UPI003979964A
MQSTPLKEYFQEPLPTEQSELLTQFYRAYTAWIDDGAPERIIFHRNRGLCGNLRIWALSVGMNLLGDEYQAIRSEMYGQFRSRYMDGLHPFNDSLNEFNHEADTRTCHQNLQRIKWARRHAE